MKPTFVKKNTAGGAAGHSWEAGEVKELNSYLAEELVILSPEDYEIVPESEYTPTEAEEESTEENAEENTESEAKPVKAQRATKKSNTNTETPSAE